MRKATGIQAIVFVCLLVQAYFVLRGENSLATYVGFHGGGGESDDDYENTADDPSAEWVMQLHPQSNTSEHNESQRHHHPLQEDSSRRPQSTTVMSHQVTLDDLVSTGNPNASQCVGGRQVQFMDDVIGPNDVWDRRIPRIVHVTGKTRCLTLPFVENVNKWKLKNHSFYFHDEMAVDRLLQDEDWPEFPQLKMLQHCLLSGAGKADLWRYLILYRYGGIYTDLDNAPGVEFIRPEDNSTIISDDDDAFFVVERIGVLSQYFMASSPRHPLMYLSVMQVFHRLLDLNNVAKQYVPFVTGPGALKNAFIRFMGPTENGQVSAGQYVGHNNRSITVVGSKRTGDRFVHRESIERMHKKEGYEIMGMQHFSKTQDKSRNMSCFLLLYELAENATAQLQ